MPVYDATVATVNLLNPRAQAREETVSLVVGADVQPLTEVGDEVIRLQLRDLIGTGDGVDPWQPDARYDRGDKVFYSGRLYECWDDHRASYSFNPDYWDSLGDFQGRIESSFFDTDRGRAALEHAVERARARLRYKARAVRIECEVPLEDVLDLQIDHRARIYNPRFQGGQASGKVISYEFMIDSDGRRDARVEIGACVGRGGNSDLAEVDTSDFYPPRLGPRDYPATGRVTPTAGAQLEALRKAPDAHDVSVRVEIDAPPVPGRDIAFLLGDHRPGDYLHREGDRHRMNTFASLIRAHEADPRSLYQVAPSKRQSAPGRYDETASQRSPALERREEKEAARSRGKDLGLDTTNIRDFEDLQRQIDLDHDGEFESDASLSPEELPLDQPIEVDPALASPEGVPPTEGRVFALMDGRLAYSGDGGHSWYLASGSPSAPGRHQRARRRPRRRR